MNVLILAAGYATRLYPLTLNKAKPLLEIFQAVGRAPDDVVHRRARRALVLGDLGERPIASQRKVEDLLLVLGEKRPVTFEQGKVAAPGREAVKAHAFTVYSVLESADGAAPRRGFSLQQVGEPAPP